MSSTQEPLLYGWSRTTLKRENQSQKKPTGYPKPNPPTFTSPHDELPMHVTELRRPPTTHIWRTSLLRSTIMLTYGERPFIDRRSCWPDDHRLRTLGKRRFTDRRSCWQSAASSTDDHAFHTFDDHRLRTLGDRLFIDRRSCWPLQTTTDYAR